MKRFCAVLSALVVMAMFVVSCAQGPAVPTSAKPGGPAPAAPATIRLLMGSTSSATSLYAYAVAAGNTINKYAGWVQVTTVETGATRENIYKVNTGELDFAAVATLAELYTAYRGIADYKVAYPDLRVFWGYYTTGKMYAVRTDAGINTMYDLEGKKFNPGRTGSETESTTMTAQKILGIKPDYFLGSTPNAVAAMKDRKIVGFAQIGAGFDKLDASMLDVMQSVPIKIIGFPENGLDKLRKEMPWLTWKQVPAGSLKEMPKNDAFWTTDACAPGFGLAQMSPDIVYAIVKAVSEHPEEQNLAFPPTLSFDVQRDMFASMASYQNPIPLHAGAVKYYREKGYNIPPSIIPPEMK